MSPRLPKGDERDDEGILTLAVEASGAGYSARFAAWDGAELAFLSEQASPPGARLGGALDGMPLRLKVGRCRRHSATAPSALQFLVVARPLDLRRDVREALERLAAKSEGGSSVPRW
jgi:hypothetical protein